MRGYLSTLAGVATGAALLLAVNVSAPAAVIQGVTIKDVSSQLDGAAGTNFNRSAVHAIDGSGGVPLNSYTGEHSNDTDQNGGVLWLSTGNGIAGGGVDPHVAAADGRLAHIVFDLGDVYDITRFHVWNYNEVNLPTRGTNGLTIRFSETNTLAGLNATGAGISTLGGPTTFTEAPGANGYAGEDYNAAFRARFVRFDINSSYNGDNNFVGLSEIRFDGTAVPEPTSLGLGLSGLYMLFLRRRRS